MGTSSLKIIYNEFPGDLIVLDKRAGLLFGDHYRPKENKDKGKLMPSPAIRSET